MRYHQYPFGIHGGSVLEVLLFVVLMMTFLLVAAAIIYGIPIALGLWTVWKLVPYILSIFGV